MLPPRLLLAALLLSALVTPCSRAADDVVPTATFEAEIKPILDAKCTHCHGAKKRSAGLSMATTADLLRGGESGAVLVAGKPDESPLYEKVRDREMPPEGNEPLSAAQIEAMRRWIADGAKLPDS